MQIHGKEYVEVKDRILQFNKENPNGTINVLIVQQDEKYITMRAIVTPDYTHPDRYFVGHAQEWKDDPTSMVNKTSSVENCETSAVGRALAMMGIGVVDSVASADEVIIAQNKEKKFPASKKQVDYIKSLAGPNLDAIEKAHGKIETLTSSQASKLIEELKSGKEPDVSVEEEPPFGDQEPFGDEPPITDEFLEDIK